MTPNHPSDHVVRIGTRTSKLALWQTKHVAGLIERQRPDLRCEFVPIVTQGDKRLDRPLPEIGGKGLFTVELEVALRRGEIDLAVHSLKDLPVDDAPGLTIGAILSREDVRDVLVSNQGWTLATLPQGAVVGTSSLRRQAQLLARRSDLIVRPIRGNVDTRIRKVREGEYDAAVMAGAGLLRLGLDGYICEWLALDVMLPAPGQGALAIQCRTDDPPIRSLLDDLNEESAALATHAERHLLWLLGGGCSAPVAAFAEVIGQGGEIQLRARVAGTDGAFVADAAANGLDAQSVAAQVAADLRRQGADRVLSGGVPRPLAGKRVVVTRPKQQTHELAALLEAQGAQVILAPSAQVTPLADQTPLHRALKLLNDYDWLLFTSANAVEVVCAQPGVRQMLADPPPALRIAAVGPASAAALNEWGIAVDFVPSRYHGDMLAEELPIAPGERVLLPRSAIARAALPERLAARGAHVDEIPVYTTSDAPLDEDVLAALRRPWEIVIFASGSTVRGFAAAAAQDAAIAAHFDRAQIACIGPATAAVVQELGYTPHIVAAEHTAPGLVAALVESSRREG